MGMGGEGEAVFTVMGSGRCWTMTETKERLERRTSKKPFPFQFSVSPVSSATGSFFLSPSSSLNCCLPNPLFFLSPPCSPCLPPRLPVSPSVSPLCAPTFLMSSCWNSPSASSLLPFFFSSLGAAPRLSSHPSFPPFFLACVPPPCDTCAWLFIFYFFSPFRLSFFWRRHRVVTDQVTKLRIKSMFNSDDCGPLTENSGSLSSIKGLRKKGGIEGGCWLGKRKNVWRRLTGIMELSSDVSVAMRRSHQANVNQRMKIFFQLDFFPKTTCVTPHVC